MAKDQVMMPQGSAGLIRYFDSSKEAITLTPSQVALISAGIIVFEIAVKLVF